MSSEGKRDEEPILTMFDDQEIPYGVLNDALSRFVKILDEPLVGKETFPPVKLDKAHVDFLLKETTLNKVEVECLLTRTGGNLEEAIKMYLESPVDKSFKF